MPPVRRENPNNMRYENSRPMQGQQHICSAIYAITGSQCNPVVSRITIVQQDIPICKSDKIGFNIAKSPKSNRIVTKHIYNHLNSSSFRINRYREAVRLERFLLLTGQPQLTFGTTRAVPVLVHCIWPGSSRAKQGSQRPVAVI